jgi:DNA invertase Pin-like site-specific DNA recombinase
MSLNDKIKPTHLQRLAFVYIRQSSEAQVLNNRESTDRQYKLVDRAVALGWQKQQIKVVDEDLGHSASASSDERSGFVNTTAEVALGHVGLILSIEVSRVARSNADWYRLLDLCSVTDTLLADEDGLYHPGLFNDRLVLGLKGTMAEAELHVIRARLEGGVRNKASPGELRRALPVGFIWGEKDGEVLFHPDQAVTGAIRTVFEKFAEIGSARQVWLWFRSQALSFPLQASTLAEIQWGAPTYATIYHVLTNPVYAGAYIYGKTQQQRCLDKEGRLRKRARRLPPSQWHVLIRNHHEGFIDWETYEMNQARIAQNTRPHSHQSSGAVREGAALLQGIATCGRCGRRLRVFYGGRYSTPNYYCSSTIVDNRETYCMRAVGGIRIDAAVAQAFLEAAAPAGMEAALHAEQMLTAEHEAALAQWRLQVERARYDAERAQRRYQMCEPENRLVARTLEAEWEQRLTELSAAEAELARREQNQPRCLDDRQRELIRTLGADLSKVWNAPTTTHRDRKELLRTLLEEVKFSISKIESKADLTLRWRSGLISELSVDLQYRHQAPNRTDEDTVALVRRLAQHYNDDLIAGILNRQKRQTGQGLRFSANRVGNLRRSWKIPRYEPPTDPPEGQTVTVQKAAKILGTAPSTIHRWLNDGVIPGEQITPGAPWQIRITDELRARFVGETPAGYLHMLDAIKILGVSRQTIVQRIKRGELSAVHVCRGKRKGLYIKVTHDERDHSSLFDQIHEQENKI